MTDEEKMLARVIIGIGGALLILWVIPQFFNWLVL